MSQGPLGAPRPLVGDDGEGPMGLNRPFTKSVERCMNSTEAQRYVDNVEEARGTPIESVEEKRELKRAWCEGMVDTSWLDEWSAGLERTGIVGLRDRLGFTD